MNPQQSELIQSKELGEAGWVDHECFHSWIRSPRGLGEEARALGHLDGSKQRLLPMDREIFRYLTTGASVPVAHQLNMSPDNSPLPKRPGGGPRAKYSSSEDTGISLLYENTTCSAVLLKCGCALASRRFSFE